MPRAQGTVGYTQHRNKAHLTIIDRNDSMSSDLDNNVNLVVEKMLAIHAQHDPKANLGGAETVNSLPDPRAVGPSVAYIENKERGEFEPVILPNWEWLSPSLNLGCDFLEETIKDHK